LNLRTTHEQPVGERREIERPFSLIAVIRMGDIGKSERLPSASSGRSVRGKSAFVIGTQILNFSAGE
jgi:hypothetical protein